ncbi:hypothetical protein [Caballeronia terrestris]|uniref:hypothetical protein n=1 Tax=Caballeronia terrestris TaxID=1226301 RepID=UPI000A42DB77|nr:hypothetical protein [Caballeronia terrestris]
MKEALDLKTKLIDASIDVSKDLVKKTVDALLGGSKKDDAAKAVPGNIRITITQNNTGSTAGSRGGSPPPRSRACSPAKK